MGQEMNLISININGLNSPIKRTHTFKELQKLNMDIIILQEVHIRKQHQQLLENKRLGTLFTSLSSQKKRGIAVYIRNHIHAKQIYMDDEGRILMNEIKTERKTILLVSIYAPNDNQNDFFRRLHNKINELDYEHICIIGDYNAIIDKDKDYKGTKKNKSKKKLLPDTFKDLAQEYQLSDAWRERNKLKNQYTFYSNPHKSWSRIDMAWMTSDLRDEIKEIVIEPNTWADHHPIKITWKGQPRLTRWMMDREIIRDKEYSEMMRKEMLFFFQINKGKDTSLQILWDTAKAYIRGLTIAFKAKKNKDMNQRKNNLLAELKQHEEELQMEPNKDSIKNKLNLTKHKINLLTSAETAKKIKLAKQNYFESANKTGRWLAYRLKKEKEKRKIPQLQDEQGQIQYGNNEKKNIAKIFYQNLYSQEEIGMEEIRSYLNKTNVQEIDDTQKEQLNRPISLFELLEARKKQKNNKSPGPDGIPAEFYKMGNESIDNTLLQVYNEVLSKAQIPNSWTESIITLIPKEDTDLTEIKNYRPISLLNSDYKLFTLIISQRLKNIMAEQIHEDQNGFIPNRYIKNNIRTIIDILEYYEQKSNEQLALLFLDAQKAFDNLNWQFLMTKLEKMKMGEQFLNIIKSIYSKQLARIWINGELTEQFPISKGVRQGCPLSPLLFIIALEVLLDKIREDSEIKGLKIKNQQYKLQAFADDVVIILEQPIKSGLKLLETIEQYSKVAGLKINKQKTKLLTKNMTKIQEKELEEALEIQTTSKIKYLGIWLSNKVSSLKEDNYIRLNKQIQKDLNNWSKLRLSLLGKVASVKMNVLPRILYLFQTIPINPGRLYFRDLDKLILKYIWQGKKARIKLKHLQDRKERGGLGLPEWQIYYIASSLTWIKDWINLKNKRILTLEGFDLSKGWHAFLWEEKTGQHEHFRKHYIRNSLAKTWSEIRKNHYNKIPRWYSIMEAQIYPNAMNIGKMKTYHELLNKEGTLKTREELNDQGVDIDWWPYMLIKSKYDSDIKNFGIEQEYNGIDKILLESKDKLITRIYNFLLKYKLEEEVVKENMVTWARNFGYSIDLDKWESLWTTNIKLTMSASYKENTYKMFYRWHLPPARLSKMFPNVSQNCWKCKTSKGTLYHMWWTCPKAREYWKTIHKILKEITSQDIPLKPETFLLGILTKKYNKEIQYLIIHIMTAARITFAQLWKKEEIPSQRQLIQKVLDCAEMDRLTKEIQNKQETEFYTIWEKWYEWLDKQGT